MLDRRKVTRFLLIILSISILSSCGKTSFKDINIKKHDFRSCDLGDSVEDVLKKEKYELTDETHDGVFYQLIYDNITVEGKKAKLVYRFNEDELISVTLTFENDESEFHQKLKDYCVDNFGKNPTITKSDFVVWVLEDKESVLATDYHSLTFTVYNPYYLEDLME